MRLHVCVQGIHAGSLRWMVHQRVGVQRIGWRGESVVWSTASSAVLAARNHQTHITNHKTQQARRLKHHKLPRNRFLSRVLTSADPKFETVKRAESPKSENADNQEDQRQGGVIIPGETGDRKKQGQIVT